MFMIVPASIAQVDAPNEGHGLVNTHDLLVMRPKQHAVLSVVGVTENLGAYRRGINRE